MAEFKDFEKLDIRVGEIIKVEEFPEARKPSLKLLIDFGDELGIKKSSAQITELYDEQSLLGNQVLAVINFPPRQVANFMSEVLVLGVYNKDGVVLIQPDRKVAKGSKLG
ncbi:tRNA-binding protein [Serpentinicella alkaliphila]|uniref:tRNA-binding protein n=1 Tax=Serpentinicella alkaliphila TaxID=1734049 RepID=A0A4R2TUF9_9FIRM|nr:tRNA-binding protein [Serpentinicella alkaliphila]QUH25633.1 tRNA-binding protein [Serpentinicella alkaliphila]TCQ06656.1 tRNA-binding protein [Serpentinicella alkaliphila]